MAGKGREESNGCFASSSSTVEATIGRPPPSSSTRVPQKSRPCHSERSEESFPRCDQMDAPHPRSFGKPQDDTYDCLCESETNIHALFLGRVILSGAKNLFQRTSKWMLRIQDPSASLRMTRMIVRARVKRTFTHHPPFVSF